MEVQDTELGQDSWLGTEGGEVVQNAARENFMLDVVFRTICSAKTSFVFAEAWRPMSNDSTVLASSEKYMIDQDLDDRQQMALGDFRAGSVGLKFSKGCDIAGRAWAHACMDWISDVACVPASVFSRWKLARDSGLRAAMSIPTYSQNCNLQMVLIFYSTRPMEHSSAVCRFAVTVADMVNGGKAAVLRKSPQVAFTQTLSSLTSFLNTNFQQRSDEEVSAAARALSALPFFQRFPSASCAQLCRYARCRHFNNQQEVFKQGDTATSCLIVLSGKIQVTDAMAFEKSWVLSVGDCLGDSALFQSPSTRMANAVAVSEVDVMSIDRSDFPISAMANIANAASVNSSKIASAGMAEGHGDCVGTQQRLNANVEALQQLLEQRGAMLNQLRELQAMAANPDAPSPSLESWPLSLSTTTPTSATSTSTTTPSHVLFPTSPPLPSTTATTTAPASSIPGATETSSSSSPRPTLPFPFPQEHEDSLLFSMLTEQLSSASADSCPSSPTSHDQLPPPSLGSPTETQATASKPSPTSLDQLLNPLPLYGRGARSRSGIQQSTPQRRLQPLWPRLRLLHTSDGVVTTPIPSTSASAASPSEAPHPKRPRPASHPPHPSLPPQPSPILPNLPARPPPVPPPVSFASTSSTTIQPEQSMLTSSPYNFPTRSFHTSFSSSAPGGNEVATSHHFTRSSSTSSLPNPPHCMPVELQSFNSEPRILPPPAPDKFDKRCIASSNSTVSSGDPTSNLGHSSSLTSLRFQATHAHDQFVHPEATQGKADSLDSLRYWMNSYRPELPPPAVQPQDSGEWMHQGHTQPLQLQQLQHKELQQRHMELILRHQELRHQQQQLRHDQLLLQQRANMQQGGDRSQDPQPQQNQLQHEATGSQQLQPTQVIDSRSHASVDPDDARAGRSTYSWTLEMRFKSTRRVVPVEGRISDSTLAHVERTIRRHFADLILRDHSVFLSYLDDDNDWIVLSREADWQECVHISNARPNQPISLKISLSRPYSSFPSHSASRP